MTWQAKVGYWELHRIPLNVIISLLLMAGSELFIDLIYKVPEEKPDMMFFTFTLVITLFLFNFAYSFTWLISLFIKDLEKSTLRKHLIKTYLLSIGSFFLLPTIYLISA